MLALSIQDEYRAWYTYQAVLLDFGGRTPFLNIADAEAQHVEAVSRLFTNRALTPPVSAHNPETVPRFDTFTAACAASVATETTNWQMYAGFLAELQQAGALPQDVQSVFTNLMEASRDRHLPAFIRCAP